MIKNNIHVPQIGLPAHNMLQLDGVPGPHVDAGGKPVAAHAALKSDLELINSKPKYLEWPNLYGNNPDLLRRLDPKPRFFLEEIPQENKFKYDMLGGGENGELEALLSGLKAFLDLCKYNKNRRLFPLDEKNPFIVNPHFQNIIPSKIQPVSDPRPDADGRIRIRGMLIPEGFKPIRMWQEQHPGLKPDATNIRYLYISNHTLLDPKSYYGEVFVVDPENSQWQATLGQYKRNTKTLERLLQDRLDEADIPLWVRNTRRPSRAQDFRRVRMILCPTPFSSDVEGVDRIMHRNQPKNGMDELMIHIDETGKLCLVRLYNRADTVQGDRFREFVASSIHLQQLQIEEAHGDMTKIADIFFRILVDAYEMFYKPVDPA